MPLRVIKVNWNTCKLGEQFCKLTVESVDTYFVLGGTLWMLTKYTTNPAIPGLFDIEAQQIIKR